jgi:catechol 2,3-dioxygenase-like lactoylglutathione lyase family enzyme
MGNGKNIGRALHVGVSVYDMEESLKWYSKNLGYELISDFYAPPLGARLCFYWE